jgi:uncharacterized protein YidB (DUF937 family)
MGLLDSVLGMAQQALNQNQGNTAGGSADLIKVAASLLSNDGATGGLSGLVQAFSKGGLGDVVQSWVGTGANLPVSAEQLMSVLGGAGGLGKIAQQLGLNEADAAHQLAQVLPGLVDKVTPQGQVPEGGVGSLAELATQFLTQRP